MKKCCHITSVHSPFDPRIFYKQATTLQKAGYEVVILAPYNKDETIDGIKIRPIKASQNRFHRIFFRIWDVFALAFKEKADIYHFHDPELIPIGIMLKLMGRKVVYDVHEDYPKSILTKEYINKSFRNICSLFINIVEKFSSRFFDYIVTATEDIGSHFKCKKKVVIKNYPLIAAELYSVIKQKEKDEPFTLIYVGGLSPERGIAEIVKAMEFVNNVRITLCGSFSPPSFEREIRSMRGFKRVDYLGFVDPEKVRDLMSVSDVGMVCLQPTPRYITSLPTKLFEYMANGLPVIGSNFPLMKDIIEGSKCGICVDPSEVSEIKNAITYLIQHHDKRDEMSKNGLRAVIKKYSWERESIKLLNVYASLFKDKLVGL